jgi:hypothetical protein
MTQSRQKKSQNSTWRSTTFLSSSSSVTSKRIASAGCRVSLVSALARVACCFSTGLSHVVDWCAVSALRANGMPFCCSQLHSRPPPVDSGEIPQNPFLLNNLSHSITTASTNALLLLHDIRVCTGTVTRTSEVRPELVLGHFHCEDCYTEQDMTEQQFKYTGAIVL